MIVATMGHVAAIQENEYEDTVATLTSASGSPQTVSVYQSCCYAFGDSYGVVVRDGGGRTLIQTPLGTDVWVSCFGHWYCAALFFDGTPLLAR